jgi:tetratricopeptide (TPR) repeat protein
MKVRVRAIGLLAVALVGAACAGSFPEPRRGARAAPTTSVENSDDKIQVVVGPGATQNSEAVLATWMAYGYGKAAEYKRQAPPAANESADDFALELAGRAAMSEFWKQHRDAPFADFDRQLAIWQAGFLPDLVVTVHARPGWTVPGNAINALRTEEFVTKFQGEYTAGAPVAVEIPSGKRFPDVPGADFPDPKELPVGPEICRVALEERRAAWARWAKLAPRLGGVPVSASSPVHFARQLAAVKQDAQGTPPSVTWVSDRVAYLAFVDGFCAVEARNWPLATEILTRAVSLNPSGADPRLELAGALISLKRFGDALRQADLALARANGACEIARSWRKRGYILIEMEAFEAARIAYDKSLAVDPGNPIALSELKTIAAALKQPGNWRTKPQPGQPAFDPVVVTTCREGKPQGKPEGKREGKPEDK